MRLLALLITLSCALGSSPALAQMSPDPANAPINQPDLNQPDLSEAEATEIQALIQNQLDAFQADDAERAFGYAAPSIQAQIGSPQRFLEMVQSQYAPVYRPQEVEFLDLTWIAGSLVQRVRLVGPRGERVIAVYGIEQQSDQSWRIKGCTLIPAIRGTTSA
ncbi:MAG: DUF4864 domain-containing protein [Cyanophyceae cyanobacterium]